MSTYTSEPGTRLAGRYRLVDQVNAGSGWTMWKATDETLARPVTVLTFAPGFPRVTEVVTAARAASRLTDPRLAQVFDVEDSGEGAFVVMEWVAGDTLTDMLSSGPFDAGRACSLIDDAARAISGAHGAGLAHLRLTPRSLRWTRTGGVKITGIGIDAALAGYGLTGAATEDPALADTQGLAALLYAALTGYWPLDEPTGLPPAPLFDGGPCTPRQASPDVPPAIDAVVCRALLQRPVRQEPPILTPAAFADALSAVAPPVPLPEPVQPAWHDPRSTSGYPVDPNGTGGWGRPGQRQTGGQPPYQHRPPADRSPAARGIISLVIVLVLVAIGAAAWVISSNLHSGTSTAVTGQTPGSSSSSSSPSSASAGVLTINGDSTYNVQSPDTPGNTEDADRAKMAIDGNPSTAWATQYYASAQFGGLKHGTGLLLDMGKPVKLSTVTVLFGPGGTDASLYIGNNPAITKSAFASYTQVATASNAAGSYTFQVTNPDATGQYILIWLTNLPPSVPSVAQAPAGSFQGLIYEVTVRGTAATAG